MMNSLINTYLTAVFGRDIGHVVSASLMNSQSSSGGTTCYSNNRLKKTNAFSTVRLLPTAQLVSRRLISFNFWHPCITRVSQYKSVISRLCKLWSYHQAQEFGCQILLLETICLLRLSWVRTPMLEALSSGTPVRPQESVTQSSIIMQQTVF